MYISKRAKDIAEKCKNAFSALAYRSWAAVAQALINRGHTDREIEAILRHKYTRWARDAAEKNHRWGRYPAYVVVDYLNKHTTPEQIAQATIDTFWYEKTAND